MLKKVDAVWAYRHCKKVFRPKRKAQRFCSQRCQEAYAYDVRRAELGVKTPRRKRLGTTPLGSPENGHNNPIEIIPCKHPKHPQIYYFVEARDLPPRSKGLMPPGPPPPLSAVEIACLGGHVVTVKPRVYVPNPTQMALPTKSLPADPSLRHGSNPDGSTPGALPGDYPLEYDVDGYPELPACLDRRKPKLKAAA